MCFVRVARCVGFGRPSFAAPPPIPSLISVLIRSQESAPVSHRQSLPPAPGSDHYCAAAYLRSLPQPLHVISILSSAANLRPYDLPSLALCTRRHCLCTLREDRPTARLLRHHARYTAVARQFGHATSATLQLPPPRVAAPPPRTPQLRK